MFGTYNNDFYQGPTQSVTADPYSYEITINAEHTVGNEAFDGKIYEFGSDTPLTLPYKFTLEQPTPTTDPSFSYNGTSLFFFDGTQESLIFPTDWYIAEGTDT